MLGSEHRVLEAVVAAGSIRLRLFEDHESVWQGESSLLSRDWPVPLGPASDVGSIPLQSVIGPKLFAEAQTQFKQPNGPLLVATKDEDLALARWGELVAPQRVVDYSPVLAGWALVPIELPISVVMADLSYRHGYDPYRMQQLQYFAATALGFVSATRFERVVRGLPHDIVHVRSDLADQDGQTWLGPPGGGLAADRFVSLMRRPKAPVRLVILELEGPNTTSALRLARRIRGRSGPAVLVVDQSFDIAQLYLKLTHSMNLKQLLAEPPLVTVADDPRLPRLFIADGADEALSLEPAARRLTAQFTSAQIRAADVDTRLGHALPGPALDGLAGAAGIVLPQQQVYSFQGESHGLEPIGDDAIALRQPVALIRQAERRAARVVNTWFSTPEGSAVPPARTLRVATSYQVNVSVGAPVAQSNIPKPFKVDEDVLAADAKADGTTVRVVLICEDVIAPITVGELLVPPPPATSSTLSFEITTPKTAGRISLRIALYSGNNLLQSVSVKADVTEVEVDGRRDANIGIVDWILTGRLDVPDQLEEKTISILTNDSGDGTHLIAVEATNFRDHVNLGEGLVTTLLDQARAALQWAAGDPDRREPYSFAPDNNGNPQQLRNYLTGMAEFGWNMYATLVAEKLDDEFERKLVESLAAPTTIQCARMGSSRLMYPWALVYDHPLIPDPGNQLCKEFLTAAGHGDPIEKTSCFNGNCPSKDDDNVVCPSGFWGFRHVIEQPLGEAESGDPVVATGNSDAVQVINVAGAADVFVGYNRDLDPQAAHVTAIQRLGGPNSSCASSLKDVGRGLQNHELHLVYFFCHGGSTDKNPRLGFGGETDEFLRAPDLKTWKVSWPNTHPLVFINGCETAAARPDDLALFHIHLRACKASGVIGTEIKVPVELAREVGTEILSRVVDERVSVGEAVRSMRLALLSRYNPLGLAYTPYCLAQLRMV